MIPLELWDLLIGPHILWERMQEAEFPRVLGEALLALHRGDGATRSEGPVAAAIAGFDSLFVAGGRSPETGIRSALDALGLPVCFSRTPECSGVEEGLRLLAQFGGTTSWICDLGQACFKICSETSRMRFQRDLRRLPIRTDSASESIREQRQQLRHWLGESLRVFAGTAGTPDALLFALPSRLDEASVPEGSSYIGMARDASLIADAIDASGSNPRFVLAMNDAELAALDALAEPALEPYAKTLVITLGFGLGAALVTRAPPHA